MILNLVRIARREKYTIGRLFVDGVYFCDTLEDKDRGLNMVNYNPSAKIKGQTAIPAGFYKITMKIYSPKFGGRLPRLLDVPMFSDILIHKGNTAADTSGCILVGKNSIVGKLTQSKAFFDKLENKLLEADNKGEAIYIAVG